MRRIPLLLGLLSFIFVFVLSTMPSLGQYGKRARRASLKTRNRQISRFTVRTDFSKSKKYISFGGGAGVTNYFGDLAPRSRRGSSSMKYTREYTTAFYLHRIHPHITVRGGLTWMRLRGDDYSVSAIAKPNSTEEGRYIRNLSFRNDIFEISGVGVFELFPTDRGYLRRNFLNPYGVLGLCIFRHDPMAKTPIVKGESSKWVRLQPLGTEGQFTGIPGTPKPYKRLQLGIPLGVGLRYRLADKWDLSFEVCYRFVFTDYIDDVSTKFPDSLTYVKMLEQGNELGIKMSNRSAEQYAASNGEDRTLNFRKWKRPFTTQFENEVITVEGATAESSKSMALSRYSGMENGASPRGNKRRDYWICSAFHLAYILEIKQKPPKFR